MTLMKRQNYELLFEVIQTNGKHSYFSILKIKQSPYFNDKSLLCCCTFLQTHFYPTRRVKRMKFLWSSTLFDWNQKVVKYLYVMNAYLTIYCMEFYFKIKLKLKAPIFEKCGSLTFIENHAILLIWIWNFVK